MPQAVSKRQFRFMQAILHGKAKPHARGTPPKSVAGKYASPGKDAPDQSGSNTGGTWGEKHHSKAKEKVKHERTERKKKKSKKHLKKSFEDFYKGKGAGAIVVNPDGEILIGRKAKNGKWTTPGGHLDDGESYEEAVLRELREEAGIVGHNPVEVGGGKWNGNDCKSFVIDSYKGKLKESKELDKLKFVPVHEIPWDKMRGCALPGLKQYLSSKLSKSQSLKHMLALEALDDNLAKAKSDRYDIRHKDALRLVGNSAFRFLKDEVADMKDEDFKDIHLDNHTIAVRRHLDDNYSGRISDGHKVIHQFTNRNLKGLTAELMSVFEWFLPEDETELSLLEPHDLPDDAIEGGLNELIENYKHHNIVNIYQEMENIREEIRNGMAIDLQQVEKRMMILFDKLEILMHDVVGKHNTMAQKAGEEFDGLEAKLRDLQSRIDELGKRPEIVEAFSTNIGNKEKILEDFVYLSRPSIEISPNGKIRISFGNDWSSLDKENLLKDMRAKVISKAAKNDRS